MLDHVVFVYGFNLMYAETLVKDVSPEQMVMQPGGVINHPAWSLGHLVMSSDHLGTFLGLESAAPDGWDKTFVTGGEPSGDASVYPSKDELLAALKVQHERNSEAVKNADVSFFSKSHPNEGARKYFPTVGDQITFLMTAHETDHLGQIAAWRRAMGLGSATGI